MTHMSVARGAALVPVPRVDAGTLGDAALVELARGGDETAVRVLLSVALIAPPALGMGVCFPLGLRLVERAGGRAVTPWLWGINGAFGVCASGLALGTSMTWGISTTMAVGAACSSGPSLLQPVSDRAATSVIAAAGERRAMGPRLAADPPDAASRPGVGA